MQWRHLRLVRVLPALALAALSILPAGPARGDDRLSAPGTAATVTILDAARAGLVDVAARGQGETRVALTLQSRSDRPLRVVLPPGLIAAASTGQFGFQSMGLGTPGASDSAFGPFQPETAGFRSVGLEGDTVPGIDLAAGQRVEVSVPAICLNYGLPTPTARDSFQLVDADQYTSDPRARRALRTLATIGTSRTVAQAVVWNVFNGLAFDRMARVAATRLNTYEIALAAQFVQALDATAAGDLVDPALFQQNRLFVRLQGPETYASQTSQLADALARDRLLGLPVQVVSEVPDARDVLSGLMLDVAIQSLTPSQIRGEVVAGYRSPRGGWKELGRFAFETNQDEADAPGLAAALDQAVAREFVRVASLQDNSSLTIQNELPMSISELVVSSPDGAPRVLSGVGVAPDRQATITVDDPSAPILRVLLNGL